MTKSFNELKVHYTDEMKLTGTDILNVVSNGNTPTLRKTIDRNCDVQAMATQNGIIKSNLIDIYKTVPEKDMNEDFFRGYHVAEIVLNSALHNFFMDAYGVEVEDVDIVFDVVDHRPTLHIDVADRDEDDGDDEVKPLTPVDKLKEDLDL
jgi:hypothetical protein